MVSSGNLPDPARPTARPAQTIFLEPQPYRRRRLIDAARLLPILGGFLTIVPPVLLPGGTLGSTSTLLMYLVFVWICLVVAAALIARHMRALDKMPDPQIRPTAPERSGKPQQSKSAPGYRARSVDRS